MPIRYFELAVLKRRFPIAVAVALALLSAANAQEPMFGGAERVEITPPPGFPTGGHGPAGDIARGDWIPLYARAFYFGPSHGPGIVLVTCELFALPLGLQSAVWKSVRKTVEPLGIGPEGLILSATHTHQGPGNFMSAEVYNEYGSRESGFSKELFDFLVKQIKAAILGAVAQHRAITLVLHSAQVAGDIRDQFVMNRSPEVFDLNWDRNAVMDGLNIGRSWPAESDSNNAACRALRLPGEAEEGWDLPGCPRLRAVDRRMTILEMLDAHSGHRDAALVFFAVHPSVLLHTAAAYSSDFVGLALYHLERDWVEAGGRAPVAGFFNGAEGDITARRVRRDLLEVRERSLQFRAAIEQVLQSAPQSLAPDIAVRAKLVDTRAGTVSCGSGADAMVLSQVPEFGVAAIGGAELDRTALYRLGWRAGVHGIAEDQQGQKQPALDSTILPDLQFTGLLAPASHFPRYLPLTYLRIGAFSLGVVPVEMSTTAAFRIRSVFEQQEPGSLFQVIGLADEYGSYTATASEYAAQDYMGASTVWGPQEASYLQCEMLGLRAAVPPAKFKVPRNAMDPGPAPRKAGIIWAILSLVHLAGSVQFGPNFVGERRESPDNGFDEILLNGRGLPERHLPFFEWQEQVPKGQTDFDNTRRVFVDRPDGAVVDSDDTDFLKILVEAPDTGNPTERRWAVYWLKPLWEETPGEYRFRVEPVHASQILSHEFQVNLRDTGLPVPVCPATGCVTVTPGKPKAIPTLRHSRLQTRKTG